MEPSQLYHSNGSSSSATVAVSSSMQQNDGFGLQTSDLTDLSAVRDIGQTRNSKAVLSALRALQDKIRALEAERLKLMQENEAIRDEFHNVRSHQQRCRF